MSKKKAQRVEQKVEQSQQDPQESSEVVEPGSTMQGSTSSGSSGSSTLPTSSDDPTEDPIEDRSQDQIEEPNPSIEEPNPIPPDARPAGMRSLKCVLTEDERSAYGMALAQFVTELEALEAQKANLPSQIKGVRERMRDTKSAMQNGFEYRDIDCFERDYGPTIEIVRADTGEVVDVRAAKLDDRQTTIFDALDPGAENPLDGEPGESGDGDESEDGEPYTETDGEPESTLPEPEDLF